MEGVNLKLKALIRDTGYSLVQKSGQRIYGPPPNWIGPRPPRGCEVFVGKLPRDIYEDELVPIFSRVGVIYELRLMMDFSDYNRGYAFVTYTSTQDAYRAIRELNNLKVREGRRIGVVKSVDNCRLFIGKIPRDKTRDEVFDELSKYVQDIVDVILYKCSGNRKLNRGFAFVEFSSHRAAAMARRVLVPECVKMWGQNVSVDWAEPEPDVDEETMKTVKVLYVRNLNANTSAETIQSIFEEKIHARIQRVKKIHDYAFVHFYDRQHAEMALEILQNMEIDGCNIEIRWSKPVIKEIYYYQKMNRGNAKFNNHDFTQTLMLYKLQLEKQEYNRLCDEGFGSMQTAAADSMSMSPDVWKPSPYKAVKEAQYYVAPDKLAALCKRNLWALPVYDYQKYITSKGDLWVVKVELPHIFKHGLLHKIGPIFSSLCFSVEQAMSEAAASAISLLMSLGMEIAQYSQAPPPSPPFQQVYQPIVPPVQGRMMYSSPAVPYINPVTSSVPIQNLW